MLHHSSHNSYSEWVFCILAIQADCSTVSLLWKTTEQYSAQLLMNSMTMLRRSSVQSLQFKHHIVVQLVHYYTPLVFPTLFTTYPFEFRFNFNSYFSIILNNCQLKEDTMQISCTPSFVATNCCVPVTAFVPIIFFTS